MSKTVPIELYQSWYRRALRAEKALAFYARKEHWMALAEDGPRTSFVALRADLPAHGWLVARQALRLEDQANEP